MSKKKAFELGADVARALDEIVSINDDQPAAWKEKARERAERGWKDER